MSSEAVRAGLTRLVSIADLSADDDDTRLRKRIGVAAGLITIAAPWTLPLLSPTPLGIGLAIGLSAYSIVNLAVLARTRRFERYVVVLIAAGPVFVFAANALAGGVTTSGAAWVWAFLTPAYAILASGQSGRPRGTSSSSRLFCSRSRWIR